MPSDNGRAGRIMEATPKAVVGLMKAKASPKLVEFTEAEVVPTVTEGITKAEVARHDGSTLF